MARLALSSFPSLWLTPQFIPDPQGMSWSSLMCLLITPNNQKAAQWGPRGSEGNMAEAL